MKILHTSDWHLGHTLYNYDRTEEQRDMIEQVVNIVKEEQPDAFILSGDVYHTSTPSAAVQTMMTEAIVKIHDANPEMTMVITAGNHDSGTKHEIFRTPWRALKVHTVGTLNKELLEEHIIYIPRKGYIVAVPYVNERNIPEGLFENLLDIAKEKNDEGLPIVMSAHTTVKGCDYTGHEQASEYTVGGIDGLDIEQMGTGYDYLALGHIHHEQFVHTGKHNVRYSGAPIPVSFAENYEHSVSIVEIESAGSRPQVRKITINNIHPLVTLPSQGMASWEEAKTLLKDFPDDIPAYIRLNVEIEDFLPTDANNEALALAKGKECRFCHINTKRKTVREASEKVFSVQEFQNENPINIARRYAEDLGIEFDQELTELFKEAVEQLNNEPA